MRIDETLIEAQRLFPFEAAVAEKLGLSLPHRDPLMKQLDPNVIGAHAAAQLVANAVLNGAEGTSSPSERATYVGLYTGALRHFDTVAKI